MRLAIEDSDRVSNPVIWAKEVGVEKFIEIAEERLKSARKYALDSLFEALKITEEDLSTLRRYESIALTRYETGTGIQQNVVKVQSEISRLNERRIVLLRQRDVGERRLARLIGRPLGGFDLTFEGPPLPVSDIRLEDLYGRVRVHRE